jgi:hypothetical protein
VTAPVLALDPATERLVSALHKLAGGTRLAARRLASNTLRYASQRDRFAYLVAQGYRPDRVADAMRAAGLIAREDKSEPCGNARCTRRIAPKQYVYAVRVGEDMAVMCSAACAADVMREARESNGKA